MKSLTLANKVTIIRTLLVPFVIVISIATKVESDFYNLICMGLLVIFGIGDVVDGYIARHYNQITSLGSFLDPFADKYMVFSCCMILTYYHKIPFWYLMFIFNKDVLVIAAWVTFFLRTNKMYIKPNVIGKASTLFQIVIIFMAYLNIDSYMMRYIIIVSAAATGLAGVTYIIDGLKTGLAIIRNQ